MSEPKRKKLSQVNGSPFMKPQHRMKFKSKDERQTVHECEICGEEMIRMRDDEGMLNDDPYFPKYCMENTEPRHL